MGALLALELASRHPGRFRRVGLAGLPVFGDLEEGRRYVGSRSRVRKQYMKSPGEGHVWCGPIHRLRYLWAPIAWILLSGRPSPCSSIPSTTAGGAPRGIEDIVFAWHAPGGRAGGGSVTLFHGDRDGVAPFERAVALAGERGGLCPSPRGPRTRLSSPSPGTLAGCVSASLNRHRGSHGRRLSPPAPPDAHADAHARALRSRAGRA